MKARHLAPLVATLALAAGALAASATTSKPRCSDSSVCLKAVALSYIDALASNDPTMADKVRAAPTVQKWENGIHNATTRTELVAAIKTTQSLLASIRDVRLFVARGGQDVFAMYLADGGLSKEIGLTSHVIERIGITNGLITEIEIVQCIGGPGDQSRPKAHTLTGLDFALCLRGPRVVVDPPGLSLP